MKISVITCTWNSIQYLAESVESVLAQDFNDYEFVFVDGGSTDGTLEYIRQLNHPYTLLENVGGGIARAMNEGVRHASGDIILHLHSDDYLAHPRVFSRVIQLFDTHRCDWLFGRVLSDIDGGWVPDGYVPPAYSYATLLKRNFIAHPATFIRRQVFDRAGLFDEKIRYAMDYDLWLRIGKLFEPIQVNEIFAVFRRHDGSTTQKNYLASFEDDLRVRLSHASGLARLEHVLRGAVRRKRLMRQWGR